jgi:hypothetical protein
MTSVQPVVELNSRKEDLFLVIQPLDDLPEQKVDTAHLGPIPMTRSVRFSFMGCVLTWCS